MFFFVKLIAVSPSVIMVLNIIFYFSPLASWEGSTAEAFVELVLAQ